MFHFDGLKSLLPLCKILILKGEIDKVHLITKTSTFVEVFISQTRAADLYLKENCSVSTYSNQTNKADAKMYRSNHLFFTPK